MNIKPLNIAMAFAVALSALALVPVAEADQRTVCTIYICAGAAASAAFEKTPWYMPDMTTYFCGWAGFSQVPPIGGGLAVGIQWGAVEIPECNGSCNWSGYAGGCGDQGSDVAIGGCQGGTIWQQTGASDLVFSATTLATAKPTCPTDLSDLPDADELGDLLSIGGGDDGGRNKGCTSKTALEFQSDMTVNLVAFKSLCKPVRLLEFFAMDSDEVSLAIEAAPASETQAPDFGLDIGPFGI